MRVLGRVVSGNLKEGVKILLSSSENIEDYPVGSLVIIEGERRKYLALISNVGVIGEEAPLINLESLKTEVFNAIMDGLKSEYSRCWVEAILIAQKDECNEPIECDTFPSYVSIIPEDLHLKVSDFFEKEDRIRLWNIGSPKTPRETTIYIPVDISRLIELSFGIFGKSGTGKTFLGNILAAYLALYDDYLASKAYVDGKPVKLLIFDMHSEYGLYLKDNLGNKIADGVGQILKHKFLIYSPSEELYNKYGNILPLKINYRSLDENDLRMLCKLFNVTETFESYLPRFIRIIQDRVKLGDLWIVGLLASKELEGKLSRSVSGLEVLEEVKRRAQVRALEELKDVIESLIADKIGKAQALSYRSQTTKLYSIIKYPFTLDESEDSINSIIDSLVNPEGQSIIISMGHYERETPLYMIIANLIAKKLHERLLEVEEGETKILIFLEEAHKFLSREVYYQSPFGVVAREMRKKGVTLCIIDQRPSELDPDVVSMLWTNFVFTLTNPRDVETAVSATPNPQLYSRVIPRLSKKTALIYGDAIRFPVVASIIDYQKVLDLISEVRRNYEREFNDILKDVREF